MLEVKPRPDSQVGLSIAEAARRTGVSGRTLRDLNWITICTRLRATGMPIKTIRRYAQLVAARARQREGTACAPGGPPR